MIFLYFSHVFFRSHADYAEHSQVCGKPASPASGAQAQPSLLNPAPAEISGDGVSTSEADFPGPAGHKILAAAEIPLKPAVSPESLKSCIDPKPNVVIHMVDRVRMKPGPKPKAGLKPGPKPKVCLKPGPKPKVGLKAGPKPKVALKPGPKPKVGLKPGPKPKVGLKPGPKPKIGLKPGPKPKVGLKPGPKPKVGLKHKDSHSEMKPVAGSLKLKIKLSPMVQSFIKDSKFDEPLPAMKKSKAARQLTPDGTADSGEEITSSAMGTSFQTLQLGEEKQDAGRPAKKLKISHDKMFIEDGKSSLTSGSPAEPSQIKLGLSLCPHCGLG